MTARINRRSMIHTAAGTCAVLAMTPLAIPQTGRPTRQRDRPAPLDGELVFEFVKVAHGDLERTKELIGRESRLIKAAWDWGAGDFETALGAAGHMGRPDIADFLIKHEAPFELCPAAMLGQLAVVRAALETQSSLIHVPGPHGIPLIAHARAGGNEASSVLEFLLEFEKEHPRPESGSAATRTATALDGIYAGVYRGTYANREVGYEITEHDRSITLRPLDGREPQELQRAGEHRFELSKFGVMVMFAVENGKAVAFTVTQGELQVEVERVK